jgi:hypothetical protein
LRVVPLDRSFGASLQGRLASTIDSLIARGITGRGRPANPASRVDALGPEERSSALRSIASQYERARPLDDVDRFFGEVRSCAPELTSRGTKTHRALTVEAFDARWPSRISTFLEEAGLSARFASAKQNHEAHARLFFGRATGRTRKRPAAILVHGYRGGRYAIEERAWPVSWLLENGLDVALFQLPYHANRAPAGSPPRFPAKDPRFTIEGFRQAIFDLRNLKGFLEGRGAPAVGAMGMSLGGYTAALLATVEPMPFTVLLIPLASFADVAKEAGRLVGSEAQQEDQHRLIDRAYEVVSPFARPPRAPAASVVVVGGEADRITPLPHALKLASHFGTDVLGFHGGHLLQFGRSAGFRAIATRLREKGFMTGA